GRIVIRGLGLVTPLGIGVERNWQGFLAGQVRSGRADVPLASPENPPIARVCTLAALAATEAVGATLKGTPPVTRPSRPCLVHLEASESTLPVAAAELAQAGRPCHDDAADQRTALVVATSRGPADEWAEGSGRRAVGSGQDKWPILPTTLSVVC